MTTIHLPTPPRPAPTFREDDGHAHVFGQEHLYSNREGRTPARKHRTCVMPGCGFTQVWDVRG